MEITIIDNISTIPYEFNHKYLISKCGKIYSVKSRKWIVQSKRGNGYLSVSLSINGVLKTLNVHRIVAQVWVPNPENKLFVNHKDGNKVNNNASNLEWCTFQENSIHAWSNNLCEKNREAVSKSNKRRWQDGRNEGLRETNRVRMKERWESGEMDSFLTINIKRIIHTISGEIFDGCKAAAEANGINISTLRVKLSGHRNNDTNLKYL